LSSDASRRSGVRSSGPIPAVNPYNSPPRDQK
jgi:hypothetical protein